MTSNHRRPRAALSAVAMAAAATVAFTTAGSAGSSVAPSQPGNVALAASNLKPAAKASTPAQKAAAKKAAAKKAAAKKAAARKAAAKKAAAKKAVAKRKAAQTAAKKRAAALAAKKKAAAKRVAVQKAARTAAARESALLRSQAKARAAARAKLARTRAARPVTASTPVAATLTASPSASATPTASTTPSADASATSTPATSTPAASASATSTASAAASTTPAASATPAPEAAPLADTDGTVGDLDLPRIPWEGGSKYWGQFRNANKAGWVKDDFFPVAVWWNGFSNDAEAQYDKSLGINTYVEMDPSANYKNFEKNGMFWIGPKLNETFTDDSTNWVGNFLGDEVDGRFEPAEGLAQMRAGQAKGKQGPRFNYANFTGLMVSSYFKKADAEAYMATTDAASMDMYWYTVPFCNWDNYNEDYYIFKVPQAHCRTSASYGKVVEGMRTRDAADGKLQPLWNFIELSDPNLPGQKSYGPIKPAQIKGAAMSSVINEARGLIYYNQDYGNCSAGSLVRQNQYDKNFCAKEQVEAMGEVNNFLHKMAPVLNTQSYKWDFGKGLDTMLKSKDGNAYIFAMIDGNDHAGSRTFTLPSELKGKKIEVVDENRSITPNANGTFTDTFASESTYHVYKVS